MSYQNILVPVDGSEIALHVVQHAANLAKAFNSKVTVVQVMTLDPYIASEYMSLGQSNEIIERAKEYIQTNIDKALAEFEKHGIRPEGKMLEGENIPRTLLKEIEKQNFDLVVISSHGRSGIKKLFMGSVAQSLITQVNIPVFVVKQ